MPLEQRLLEILRCPACRATLRPLPGDSGLECTVCRRIYAIVDGIPDMLVDHARLPDS